MRVRDCAPRPRRPVRKGSRQIGRKTFTERLPFSIAALRDIAPAAHSHTLRPWECSNPGRIFLEPIRNLPGDERRIRRSVAQRAQSSGDDFYPFCGRTTTSSPSASIIERRDAHGSVVDAGRARGVPFRGHFDTVLCPKTVHTPHVRSGMRAEFDLHAAAHHPIVRNLGPDI